jgi:cephalosporin-C deacetylase
MPLIDKPLAELRLYQGRNPRPDDFDAYWEAALRDLAATPPCAELRPSRVIAARGVECFDLWFNGVGGARVYAKYLRPAGAKACPAVLQFHGYSGQSGDWMPRLSYVSQGFCVAALDCRGQAGAPKNRVAWWATPCAGTSSGDWMTRIRANCSSGRSFSIPPNWPGSS